MKKLIKSVLIFSLINLTSCANPTSYKNVNEWNGDRAGEASTLTLSEINPSLYDFKEEIKSKNGETIKIAGTLTLRNNNAEFRYTKPGISFVTASNELSSDGKIYTYKILTSDTPLAIAGSKYTYTKK